MKKPGPKKKAKPQVQARPAVRGMIGGAGGAPVATKGIDDMISFRTAYLRLLAKAWANEKFRGQIARPDGVRTNSAEHKQHIKDLAESFRKHGFSVDRWEGLEFELSNRGPDWDPAKTVGWHGNGFSKITLRLPLDPPEGAGPAEQAQALADYYQMRPTMFGQLVDVGLGGAAAAGRGPDYGLGNWEDFLLFGGVTLRAIALAWQDEAFRDALDRNALNALQGWLNYAPQWNLEIDVQDAPRSGWMPTEDPELPQWLLTEKNLVTLDLPNPPVDADGQLQPVAPIALAAYNNTGELYPFTCCV
jgi:ribosomally synthesized peptide (two-chain TOMM family)